MPCDEKLDRVLVGLANVGDVGDFGFELIDWEDERPCCLSALFPLFVPSNEEIGSCGVRGAPGAGKGVRVRPCKGWLSCVEWKVRGKEVERADGGGGGGILVPAKPGEEDADPERPPPRGETEGSGMLPEIGVTGDRVDVVGLYPLLLGRAISMARVRG